MLLPGASFVIIVLAGLFDVALCALLAFWVGTLAFNVAELLIHRTNAWKVHRRGSEGTDRWWFNLKAWAGSFMLGSFTVFIYVSAGPYFTFIKYIGGL